MVQIPHTQLGSLTADQKRLIVMQKFAAPDVRVVVQAVERCDWLADDGRRLLIGCWDVPHFDRTFSSGVDVLVCYCYRAYYL